MCHPSTPVVDELVLEFAEPTIGVTRGLGVCCLRVGVVDTEAC